ERPMASDNMTLGKFRLDGIPMAPRGIPQVEVTFDIDANGIISVAAKDKASGKEQRVTITASTNLNKNDVERMVKEAESHKSEDEQRKQVIEARNTADNLAYQSEKTLKDIGEKVDSVKKADAEAKIKAVRDSLAGNDAAAINAASQSLQQVMQEIGQAAYQQGQAAGPQAGGQPGADYTQPGEPEAGRPDEGDVVEGTFKES
ncbi:MAG TPA: Hsp70 family protein, partial [Anaerolineaceae bacterium]|nr:Hsp70 family protein [Anaerolineaceae bacterium]